MYDFRKASPGRFTQLGLLGFWALALANVALAKPATCTDDSATFTISDGYDDPQTSLPYNSGIRSDGLGVYVDGDGRVEAKIRNCGSGDATLLLNSGRKGVSRSMVLDLRNAVFTNSATPSWAFNPGIVDYHFLNIHNILYGYKPHETYSFTTQLTSQMGVNYNYYFYMQNPQADATSRFAPGTDTPCTMSLVHVLHVPKTEATNETWTVWPDSATQTCNGATPGEVGTLYYSNQGLNAGQFTIPFFITIQRRP